MSKDLHIGHEPPAGTGEEHFNSAGELVRFAEKLLDQGDTAQALECLHEALKRQPDNLYITAVIQRAEAVQQKRGTAPAGPEPATISLTVDRRHPSGVRHETADGKDTDARVQRLTLVASRLFDRGAFDAAFESLMKAYLLDPGNPLVVACEKQMMPVWNTLRKTGFPGFAPEEFLAQRKPAPQVRPASPPPQTQAKPDPSSRLEERKRQLEQQRKEREQTMWRNASQPPKSMAPPPANGQEAAPRRRATPRLRDLDKYDRPGLLRWLKGE